MKKSTVLILVILSLIAISGYVLFFLETQKTAQLTVKGKEMWSSITAFVDANETLTNDKTILESKLATQTAANVKSIQEAENIKLQLDNMKKTFSCDIQSTFTFKMTNQSSASESLKNFLGDTQGKVISNTWDLVWNNTKTATHKLSTDEYLFVFIVDLKDEKMGREPAILDVGNMCFINPDQLK